MGAPLKPIPPSRVLSKRVGWALRTRRIQRGFSQPALAKLTGLEHRRISETELGNWDRGIGQEGLDRVDVALEAGGELALLRQRLRHLRKSNVGTLLTPEERFDINFRTRRREPVDEGAALYLEVLEMIDAGIDPATDHRARRTLDDLIRNLHATSSRDALFAVSAIVPFGRSAVGPLIDILHDPSNVSKWRTTEPLSLLKVAPEETRDAIDGLLDLDQASDRDLPFHRPAIDAIHEMRIRRGNDIELLSSIARTQETFMNARVQALGVLWERSTGEHSVSNDQMMSVLRSIDSGGSVVEATATDLARRLGERSVHTEPVVRLGPQTESAIAERIHRDPTLQADPMATSLIEELYRGMAERARREPALCLRAAGIGEQVAILFEDFLGAQCPEVRWIIGLHVIGLLGQRRSVPQLLTKQWDPEPQVRAMAGWAISRCSPRREVPELSSWLAREEAASQTRRDVIAALVQAVNDCNAGKVA